MGALLFILTTRQAVYKGKLSISVFKSWAKEKCHLSSDIRYAEFFADFLAIICHYLSTGDQTQQYQRAYWLFFAQAMIPPIEYVIIANVVDWVSSPTLSL